MDCEVIKDNINIYSDVFDGFLEEKIDLDIIIPDYCAAAIKILKCDVTPVITSTVIESERFIIEGVCSANVIYIDEQTGAVKSIEESVPFTRINPINNTLENNRIKIKIKTSNVICRLLNSRRVSVKTVVGLAVKISGNHQCELTVGFDDSSIEIKKLDLSGKYYVNSAVSNVQIGSELHTQGPVCDIIKTESNIFVSDIKVITDKVILKGNAKFECLYSIDDEAYSLECESINVPFSEVVEIEGIEEGDICNIDFGNLIIGYSLDSSSHNIINFELEGICFVSAYKNLSYAIVTDAYSKKNCFSLNKDNINLEFLSENTKTDLVLDEVFDVEFHDGLLKKIWSKSNIRNIRADEDGAVIEYDVDFQLLVYENNEYKIIDKNIPCETKINLDIKEDEKIRCEAEVICNNTDTVFDGDKLRVKCDVSIIASTFSTKMIEYVKSIELTDEIPDGFLGSKVVLYYAQKGESLWEIAKKYCTCVDVIKRDNNIDDDYLVEDIMLFVSSN